LHSRGFATKNGIHAGSVATGVMRPLEEVIRGAPAPEKEDVMPIMVAYRHSSAGRDALRVGARLARSRGTKLYIVSVIPREVEHDTFAPPSASYDRFVFDQMGGWLAEAASLVAGDIELHTEIEVSDSEEQGILDAAHRLHAKVIVLGTATGGLLGRFTLGSVSNALLHSSDVPVTLAPDDAREVAQDAPISRVTVAVGDLGGNRTLFDTAAFIASRRGIPVRLLTLATVDPGRGSAAADRARTQAVQTLGTAAVSSLPHDLDITTRVEVAGRIDQAVEQVDWDPAEIVLIGSSRLAQARSMFLGSTAAKLVRTLSVPMIVVPRDDVMRTGAADASGAAPTATDERGGER
jgi:nucleotide-binding universal stress UspA family protein